MMDTTDAEDSEIEEAEIAVTEEVVEEEEGDNHFLIKKKISRPRAIVNKQ
jgi:hypothetical protein